MKKIFLKNTVCDCNLFFLLHYDSFQTFKNTDGLIKPCLSFKSGVAQFHSSILNSPMTIKCTRRM